MRTEMTVGAGHHGSRNYDELMEMAGEPQQNGHAQHAHPHHGHHGHPAHHAPGMQMVPAGHVMAPNGYVMPAYAPQQMPPGYAPPPPMHMEPARAPHHEPTSAPLRRRVVEEEPTRERLFPIGFVATGIAAGEEVDIEVKPQVYFRGERLAIPQSIARYFDIIDIKIGKDSQLAATGAMPGESFSTVAVGVRMELATAKPGIVITVRVRNVDTADQDFKAVMYGCVLE
jgi:hypothetical protein